MKGKTSDIQAICRRLKGSASIELPELMSIWQARAAELWGPHPRVYALLGERILEQGEPLLAYETLQTGLEASPRDPLLRRLLALSLARSGAPARACEILERLRREGHEDEETLGILARTHKDMAALAENAEEMVSRRRMAYEYYLKAFRRTSGYYSGINAATMALLLGKREEARRLARRAREICLEDLSRLRRGKRDAYWLHATLGEAALILGKLDEAADRYGRAAALGRDKWSNLASTRRQARLLMSAMGLDAGRVDCCFRVPRVVVFAGHMIDAPGRPAPRFPPAMEGAIRAQIAAKLKDLDAGFGYASAACGSDILFIEEMLARDGVVHIVLPCPPEDFRKTSVDLLPRADWGRRFERVLSRAVEVLVASERDMTRPIAYEYSNLILHGLALLKARTLDADSSCLAVWDGKPGGGQGGTASAIQGWRAASARVEIIRLSSEGAAEPADADAAPAAHPLRAAFGGDKIRALFFADAVGYSKLHESQVPVFASRFLDVPARLLREWPVQPLVRHSWGDAVYLVFEDTAEAGGFALELCDRINRVDWGKEGLPEEMRLRIALHAGPVFPLTDPVTGQLNFIGCHVNFAARIEPITPPGQVYASQAFAALAAARGVESFSCEYVGQTALAKRFGSHPLYHLRRKVATAVGLSRAS